MKRTIIAFACRAGYGVVIALVAMSILVTAVLSPRIILPTAPTTADSGTSHYDQAVLLAGRPTAEDVSGSMTPTSRPKSFPRAVIHDSIFQKSDNDKNRQKIAAVAESHCCDQVVHFRNTREPIESTALISSSLGRQFTLVGAKPSGTS